MENLWDYAQVIKNIRHNTKAVDEGLINSTVSRIILCTYSDNERRRYYITLLAIGRAHTQNNPGGIHILQLSAQSHSFSGPGRIHQPMPCQSGAVMHQHHFYPWDKQHLLYDRCLQTRVQHAISRPLGLFPHHQTRLYMNWSVNRKHLCICCISTYDEFINI